MDLNLDLFKVAPKHAVPACGKILISEPLAQDNYFKRSIVLLTEHNDKGSVGFVLNKPVRVPVSNLIHDFPHFDAKISVGGPVNKNSLYFVHRLGKLIPDSVNFIDDLSWGGNFEALRLIVETKQIDADQIRFFIGYAGWQPGQLESEIEKNFWLVSDYDESLFRQAIDNEFWRTAVQNMGNDYKIWTTVPENLLLN